MPNKLSERARLTEANSAKQRCVFAGILFVFLLLMGFFATKQLLCDVFFRKSQKSDLDIKARLEALKSASKLEPSNPAFPRELARVVSATIREGRELNTLKAALALENTPKSNLLKYNPPEKNPLKGEQPFSLSERDILTLEIYKAFVIPYYLKAVRLNPLECHTYVDLGKICYYTASMLEVYPNLYEESLRYRRLAGDCFNKAATLAPKDSVVKEYLDKWNSINKTSG